MIYKEDLETFPPFYLSLLTFFERSSVHRILLLIKAVFLIVFQRNKENIIISSALHTDIIKNFYSLAQYNRTVEKKIFCSSALN
jgi:hypothetical protein